MKSPGQLFKRHIFEPHFSLTKSVTLGMGLKGFYFIRTTPEYYNDKSCLGATAVPPKIGCRAVSPGSIQNYTQDPMTNSGPGYC